jgi:hypothetical protein
MPESPDACNRHEPVTRDYLDGRLSQISSDVEAIRASVGMSNTYEEKILRKIDKLGATMSADFDALDADLNTLAAGYVAQQAIIKAQADALANADASAQAKVDAAVAAEDADAQTKVDAADAIAQAAINPTPPADNPPAGG